MTIGDKPGVLQRAIDSPSTVSSKNGLGNNRYAFTVTVKLRNKTSSEQYDLTYLRVHEILWSCGIKHTIIAEMTQNCDIHYHGVLEKPGYSLLEMNYIVKNRFRREKSFGFSCIKVIDDMDGWVDYLSKDLQFTYTMIDRRPIIVDAFDLFPRTIFDKWGSLV